MKIIKNHTIEEYNKRYSNIKFKLLKYSQKDVDEFNKGKGTVLTKDKKVYNKINLLEGHNWWKIDDTYYEVPKTLSCRWWKSLHKCVRVSTYVVLGAAVIAAVAIPGKLHYDKYFNSYNIQTTGSDLAINYTYRKNFEGDLIVTINLKDPQANEITGIDVVNIGFTKLTSGIDYDYTRLRDDTATGIQFKNSILIKKHALDEHKGIIYIRPITREYIHVKSMNFLASSIDVTIGTPKAIPVLEINPFNAIYPQYDLKIEDETIAKIEKNLIFGQVAGETNLIATSLDNSSISAVCKITVK